MNFAEFFEVRNRFAPWHTQRYIASLEWLQPYLIVGHTILDLGGRSAFTDAIKKFYHIPVSTNLPDLRYEFPFNDRSFDLILCMEVLEHLCDRGDSRIDIYTGSGIKNAVSEANRILRPGGHLFVTTPNVCCYNSVWRILSGKHPFSYEPHFRELAPEDVIGYLEQVGFKVERQEVLDIWQGHQVSKDVINIIDKLCESLQLDIPRGDCFFVLASKE